MSVLGPLGCTHCLSHMIAVLTMAKDSHLATMAVGFESPTAVLKAIFHGLGAQTQRYNPEGTKDNSLKCFRRRDHVQIFRTMPILSWECGGEGSGYGYRIHHRHYNGGLKKDFYKDIPSCSTRHE